MKKTIHKFKTSVPLTDAEIAELRPCILEWTHRARLARSRAQDLFEAYEALMPGEFVQYIEAHPPTPQTIAMLVSIAVAASNPDKPSELGKQKAQKLYGEAKAAVLAAWKTYHNSPSDKGKAHFARLQAKKLKNAKGDPIAPSTIYRWLPKKK